MMNVKNAKCIRHLSFRSLWASRRRNLIAVAAIVLTTLLFTSLFTVAMSFNANYEMFTFRQMGGYCHGSFKDVTEEQMQAISAHRKVKAAGERIVIGYINSGVFTEDTAEVSFMDENCATWSFATPDHGRMPQNGNEITMDTKALSLLGVDPEIGAEVSLTYHTFDENGTTLDRTDTFTLVGWWEYDTLSPTHYINISREYAKNVEKEAIAAGMQPFRSDLLVMMVSSMDIRGQMEQVDRDLGYTWETRGAENSARIGVNWGYTTAKLGESIDATTIIAVAAFLLLVIFTGYLIIYNIFQISVTGDIRFYGLLKTIGVTPRQLGRIIRQQALLLCVAGIPVGLLAGYAVGALLTPVVLAQTTLGTDRVITSASPLIFIASALFSLITVLISCARPGRLAGKVSPVEATKYTEALPTRKKSRSTHGAKVYQMAFANLGRNKSKTTLVIISLTLSVVLLNMLVMFTGGFDTEKFLKQQTCADFIVSSADYFNFTLNTSNYFSEDVIQEISSETSQTTAGCGYTLSNGSIIGWMPEESWRTEMSRYTSEEALELSLNQSARRGDLVGGNALMEGLDKALFDKLTVVEGDINPLFQEDSHAIALAVYVDDYGNVSNQEYYPPVGSIQPVTYAKDFYYVDSRTGEKSDENTPYEFLEYHIADSIDIDYTICAYVYVPNSMSHRYQTLGYSFVLPVEKLAADSGQTPIPMFYLFDTPDAAAEQSAEAYLTALTKNDTSGLMYESKATLRTEFDSLRNMFLILGGVLCAVIGLVGVLNFFNAIMTGILSRKREFAVLQAVGMTKRQLKSMLICEGLFYALGASAAALVLSLLLNPLIGGLLENMFWFFRAGFTFLPVLLAVPVFALLGCLIPSIVYGHAARQSIIEQLS